MLLHVSNISKISAKLGNGKNKKQKKQESAVWRRKRKQDVVVWKGKKGEGLDGLPNKSDLGCWRTKNR